MAQPQAAPVVLTPDQRLRVFVSSTLEELAAERDAVRAAITELHLAPVMFELAARPHPPRTVYRSYLEQSHVFIGIYWQRYGWIGPGMEISGLEDEWIMADGLPRLVYVKKPAPDIEPRLHEMLGALRSTGDLSYRAFSTAEELKRLVADDLALMLSERFAAVHAAIPAPREPVDAESASAARLPGEPTPFIGRESELAILADLLADPAVRLVTLVGPGGIGKTRLAIHAAKQVQDRVPDGVRFVSLDGLDDARLVAPAIGRAFGLRDLGPEPPVGALGAQLRDTQGLLVLDNFEHLIETADLVADLLAATPHLRILVTSREPLRLRAEHEVLVPPLGVPDPDIRPAAMAEAEAVRLFADRATSAAAGFDLADQVRDVAAICRDLDGIPLAIELAAARVGILPPAALRDRLKQQRDSYLSLLVAGPRDLPDRQRTLRSTIDWSYQLLSDEEKQFFAQLACFRGGCTLEAAEAVCDAAGNDALLLVSSLADKSLLRLEASDSGPRLRMLETLHQFAREQLEAAGRFDDLLERHADYFRKLLLRADAEMRGSAQAAWMTRLAGNGRGDLDNVRASMTWLLHHRRVDDVATMAWALWLPTWMAGTLDESRRLITAALAVDAELSDPSRARLQAVLGMFSIWSADVATALPAISESLALARNLGDDEVLSYVLLTHALLSAAMEGHCEARSMIDEGLRLVRRRADVWGEATGLVLLGWLCVALEDHEGNDELFTDSLNVARTAGDLLMLAMAEDNLAEHLLHSGDLDDVPDLLGSALESFRCLRAIYPAAYAVDGVARASVHAGEPTVAATLLAIADRMRREISVPVWASAADRHAKLVGTVRDALGDEAFRVASELGDSMPFDEGVRAAQAALDAVRDAATNPTAASNS